jgi:hypothetical protein
MKSRSISIQNTYLRPPLRDHPDLVVLAVAYMIPVINYGEIVTDEHCRCYGTTLLGLMARIFGQAEYHDSAEPRRVVAQRI